MRRFQPLPFNPYSNVRVFYLKIFETCFTACSQKNYISKLKPFSSLKCPLNFILSFIDSMPAIVGNILLR